MRHPDYGFIKSLWCDMGKPFRNNLIRLNNTYEYKIKRKSCPFKDMKELVGKEKPVIVDGGANNGGTITSLKQYIPNSIILAFEPLEFLGLKKNTKEFNGVHILYIALGEEDKEIEMNITPYPDTSSFFVHRDASKKEHLKVGYMQKVKMVSLDSWLKDKKIDVDIIKLDLQGYELNALKGAKKTLEKTKVVFVECCFQEMYVNQPLFCDIVKFMESVGFEVYNLYRNSRKGKIGYVDVLFEKVE